MSDKEVISCPQCEARYSIPQSVFIDIDKPEFHCSRCNSRFQIGGEPIVDEKPAIAQPESNYSEPEGAAIDEWTFGDTDTESGPEKLPHFPDTLSAEQLSFLSEQETAIPSQTAKVPVLSSWTADTEAAKSEFAAASIGKQSFSWLNDEEELPAVTADWPSIGSDNELYETNMARDLEGMSFQEYREMHAERERASSSREIAAWTQERQSLNSLDVELEEDETKPTEENALEAEQGALPEKQVSSVVPLRPSPEKIIIQDESWDQWEETAGSGEWRTEPELENRKGGPLLGSAPRVLFPMLILMLVPAIAAYGFWQLGNTISASPQMLQTVFAMVDAEPIIAPPEGLEIRDLETELVTLDDGTRVLDARGQLSNMSAVALRDLHIEAQLFDAANNPLTRTLIRSNNGLVGAARIESLRPDAIEELQQQQSVQEELLAVRGRTEFRIVLPFTDDGARWFSTRVYSARKVG